MRMTLPQIIMLNHAAWVNSKRSDERIERDKQKVERDAKKDTDDPIVWNGKRFSEMNDAEQEDFYSRVLGTPEAEQ